MVQTFDFMSKNYKHVLIQKVTFSTKKELLTQPYTTQENHVSMHKTYVYTNQTMLYLHTHFLHRDFSVSIQCLPFTTILS